MTMTAGGGSITRAPRPSSLADVLDLILDKGLVIDAYVRVSAVGIELLTIDARIVIASVDTYLHYAEAVNRLDLVNTETRGITGLFDEDEGRRNGSSSKGSDEDSVEGSDEDSDDEPDEEEPDRELSPPRGSGESEHEDGGARGDDDREPTNRRGIAARLQERGKWS